MRAVRRLFWAALATGLGLVAFGVVPSRYVLAPLLGLLIWRIGTASFASLRAGGAHVPEGDPVPVDLRTQRVTYWCPGCGAEFLLLVRGAASPPRHCGERTVEREEVAHAGLS